MHWSEIVILALQAVVSVLQAISHKKISKLSKGE